MVPTVGAGPWLEGCLDALAGQSRPFAEVVVVVAGGDVVVERPGVRVVRSPAPELFAAAANRGIAAVGEPCDAVALVNDDVELAPEWLERAAAVLERDGGVGSVACKMVQAHDPSVLDDCGDVLRRDGVCEQRGRRRRDDGRWDGPGDVFSACAGAALYRRSAVEAVDGFDERLGMYLEDVDLGLRLRLAGWRCAYEPVVARHRGGGSVSALVRPPWWWVERNTLLICARAFPLRWWVGPVAYRQLAWAVRAARERRLGTFLRGALAALPLLPAYARERRALRRAAKVPVDTVVAARPWRGPRAGGHPRAGF